MKENNNKMSKESRESFDLFEKNMSNIEIKMAKMEKDTEYIKRDISVLGDSVSGLHSKMDSFIKRADDKYAEKSTVDCLSGDIKNQDKFVKGALVSGILALLSFIFSLIKDVL